MKKTRPATIHDPRYQKIIKPLVNARKVAGLNQSDIADAMGLTQPDISKIERLERRLDALELVDYIAAVAAGDLEKSRGLLDQVIGLKAKVQVDSAEQIANEAKDHIFKP
jgi:transcriptional regulator with XRE-family HTH domain